MIVTCGGLVGFAVLYAVLGVAELTNILGFAYPAYASFRAIESPDKTDDTQWLTYWVVFAGFSMFEVFEDFLEEEVPMYYAFKFAFLIWLSAPPTRGAEFLYKNFIKPFMLQHEKQIDTALKQAEEFTEEVAESAQEIAHDKAGDIIDEVKDMAKEADYEQVETTDAQ